MTNPYGRAFAGLSGSLTPSPEYREVDTPRPTLMAAYREVAGELDLLAQTVTDLEARTAVYRAPLLGARPEAYAEEGEMEGVSEMVNRVRDIARAIRAQRVRVAEVTAAIDVGE